MIHYGFFFFITQLVCCSTLLVFTLVITSVYGFISFGEDWYLICFGCSLSFLCVFPFWLLVEFNRLYYVINHEMLDKPFEKYEGVLILVNYKICSFSFVS